MDERRYREAEQNLWGSVGLRPIECRIAPGGGPTIRVQEIGVGPPVLFLHGGPNAGSTFATLAAHLDGFRCLFVDRPGTGLSEPRPALDVSTLPRFADAFVADVLDALDIDRADVVASSVGGYIALRSAAAHPDRVRRSVQLGCPPFTPGVSTPPMMRVLSSPLQAVIRRLPANERSTTMMLKQIGHARTISEGGIPVEFLRWYVALQRFTNTLRSDGALIRNVASPLRGFSNALTLGEEVLGSVASPTLLVWGAQDPFGGEEVGRRLAAAMPDARLQVFPDAGHLPWLDEPDLIGKMIVEHLSGTER